MTNFRGLAHSYHSSLILINESKAMWKTKKQKQILYTCVLNQWPFWGLSQLVLVF